MKEFNKLKGEVPIVSEALGRNRDMNVEGNMSEKDLEKRELIEKGIICLMGFDSANVTKRFNNYYSRKMCWR